MIEHIIHPVKFLKYLYNIVSRDIYRHYVERQLLKIPRGKRYSCWCGGALMEFKWHQSYGVCAECGCYVNRQPPRDLEKVYNSQFYWHMIQKYYGYPPIESRAELYRKDGRLLYWLQLIERYCTTQGGVIEVGCAPGVLLSELQSKGYRCLGVEPDRKTAEWIHKNMKVEVVSGLFPEVNLPKCDIFLAFDVLEHSMFPNRFMKAVGLLLNNQGIAIIQTPIERYGYNPPFGERFHTAFNDVEHLFLFTQKSMDLLAAQSDLEIIAATERLWLHHEINIFRKSNAFK